MAIQDKPFNYDEQLRDIIFKGRPAFFNAIDFNKRNTLVKMALEDLERFVGLKSNVSVSVSNITDTIGNEIQIADVPNYNQNDGYKSMSGSFGTKYYERTIEFDYVISSGYSYYNGVRFKTDPKNGHYSYTYAWLDGSPPVPVYIIITSEVLTKEFGDGQPNSDALCGIQSNEYPTLVPSCKVVQYTNTDISLVTNPGSVGTLIAILATVTPDGSTGSIIYGLNLNAGIYDGILYSGSGTSILYSNNSVVEQIKYGYLEFMAQVNQLENELNVHISNYSNPHNVDGIIYRGVLGAGDDLNGININGLWRIDPNAVPAHFPTDAILQAGSTRGGLTQHSKFWLKNIVMEDGVQYQELGFRRGVIAFRQFDSLGIGGWESKYATIQEVKNGVRQCGVVNPYTLKQAYGIVGDWVDIPTSSVLNGWVIDPMFRYRRLPNGLIQVQGVLNGVGATSDVVCTFPIDVGSAFSVVYDTYNGNTGYLEINSSNQQMTIKGLGSNVGNVRFQFFSV